MLEFGRFRILLRRRQLLADGVPIALGTRAFDLLLVLLEAEGSLVGKEELLNRVRPNQIVEENNLPAQRAALRCAIGCGGAARQGFGEPHVTHDLPDDFGRRPANLLLRGPSEGEAAGQLMSLEATRQRHVGTSPHPERYDPDLWTDELAFLSIPGQDRIQSDLLYDYRTNVASYPRGQAWLRRHQPYLLVLWGVHDPSFVVAGAEAYRTDVPSAQVHLLQAGHFALDAAADEVAEITTGFLERLPARVKPGPV